MGPFYNVVAQCVIQKLAKMFNFTKCVLNFDQVLWDLVESVALLEEQNMLDHALGCFHSLLNLGDG